MNWQKKILKSEENFIIIFIWGAVLAAPLLIFDSSNGNRWGEIHRTWMTILPFFILFIINHFVLMPWLMFRKRKVVYFLSAIGLVILFNAALFFNHWMVQDKLRGNDLDLPKHPPLEENIQSLRKPFPPPHRQSNYPPILSNFILSILLIGFDSGLRMITKLAKTEKDKNIIEKENVENQLAFLKNQVSPHFFMNTLNNIHSLMDFDVEQAKDSVIKLSKLMRHLLYETDANLTPLKKEIEFVKSYVNLMKLRLADNVSLELIIPEVIPERNIPPLLFTSLIENAFKHGISYSEESYISIIFDFKQNELFLEIKNSKAPVKKEEASSGIGMVNTLKRLELLYKGNYKLDITETEKEFKVNLKMPL